jgi:hypothetical protein
MARADHQASRVDYLLQLLCDEQLEESEAVELSELLATSESARRRYVETVQLTATLADWSQPSTDAAPVQEFADGVATQNGHSSSFYEAIESRSSGTAKNSAANAQPSDVEATIRRINLPVFAAVAAVLMLALGWWLLHYLDSRSDGSAPMVAGNDNAAEENGAEQRRRAPAGTFVAYVVEVTADAEWEEGHQPPEFLMRLRAGDQLHLRSGLAHLQFYSGARIILQGPSKFTPTGPAGGTLESGRLTGKVDVGKFWLTTPTAKVIDLGTEFGVTVGPTSDTDVCVFDGEIQVRPDVHHRDEHRHPAEGYHLTRGMSVRVAATGKVSDGMHAGVDYEVYTRSFPMPAGANPGELDLVDIVCGGNGQGARLAAAIDPLTGEWDKLPWKNELGPGTRMGDRMFHAAGWHPFIDGTFVPNQFGEPFQVDTLGGTTTLPKSRGHYTWGPLWARRAVTATQLDKSMEFWGTQTNRAITDRLGRCRLGGIGIHSSVGITFDLQSIATTHSGHIRSVKGILTNLENSKTHNPEWANANPPPEGDFLIFVDGEKRYEVLDFARNIEGEPFEVNLSPRDRFLTFITTDGGDSNRYDHMILIDPVLEIDAPAERIGE